MPQSIVGYPSTDFYEYLKLRSKNNITAAFASANVSLTYQALKDSVVCVNIFYQKLQYTSITETQQKTIFDMVNVVDLFLILDSRFSSFLQ
jgi:hypothetical protein